MYQIAAGKRVNGVWHVWVKIGGQWYGAIDFNLERAFTLAVGTIPMGRAVSTVIN